MNRTAKPTAAELGRVTTIGGLLGIKTSSLLLRLAPVAAECRDDLLLTIPHSFDAMSVTTHVTRELARSICGDWLDALPGDRLALEISGASIMASSDEAALPAGSPDLVAELGDELIALGHDGTTWTYVIAQANADNGEATIARIERVGAALGVTAAQRRIAAGLHRSLARGTSNRAWLRARGGVLDPVLGLAWDRVEWQPIQSMLAGFYPAAGAPKSERDGLRPVGGVEKIARLSRAAEVEHATVELVLGPTDPPGLRIAVRLEGA